MSVASASLIAMPARWSADRVLDLAPDESSRRSAGCARAAGARGSGAGVAGDVLWGLCAGSGKNPYQVVVDLSGPAYKCSCPSRKFPCKHALGLLLNWANGSAAGGERARRLRRRLAGRPPRPSGKSGKISRPNGPGRLTDVRRARHRQGRSRRRAPGAAARPAGGERPGRARVLAQGPGPGRPVGHADRRVRCRSFGDRVGEGSRGRDRGADGRRAGPRRRRRPARAVGGTRVGRGMARPPAGRVRAAAPARPRAPAAWRPAARSRRHRQVQGRLPDQPPGRARPPAGDRPLDRARRPRPAGRAGPRSPPLAARPRQRPVGDAAHVRRARPGGRGRRLAGPGHGPAPARDRAAREPALLPRPARAARDRGGAARRAGPVGVGAGRRRRRRPAGRVRRRPGTRSLADRVARPAPPGTPVHRETGGGWSTRAAPRCRWPTASRCGPCSPCRAGIRSRWPASGTRTACCRWRSGTATARWRCDRQWPEGRRWLRERIVR